MTDLNKKNNFSECVAACIITAVILALLVNTNEFKFSHYEIHVTGNIQIGESEVGIHEIKIANVLQKTETFNGTRARFIGSNSSFIAPAAAYYDIRVHTSAVLIDSKTCAELSYAIYNYLQTVRYHNLEEFVLRKNVFNHCTASGTNSAIVYLNAGDKIDFRWASTKLDQQINVFTTSIFIKQL